MNLTIDEQLELLATCHKIINFIPTKSIDDLYKRIKTVKDQFKKKTYDTSYERTFIEWINRRNIGELMLDKDIDIIPLLPKNKITKQTLDALVDYLDSFNYTKPSLGDETSNLNVDETKAIKIFIKYMDMKFLTGNNRRNIEKSTLAKFFEVVTKKNISCEHIIRYEPYTDNYDMLFTLLLKYPTTDIDLLLNNDISIYSRFHENTCNRYDFILKCLKDKTVMSYNIPATEIDSMYTIINNKNDNHLFENFKKFITVAQNRNIPYGKIDENYFWLLYKANFNISICNRVFDHIEKGFEPHTCLAPILKDLKLLPDNIPNSVTLDNLIRTLYGNSIKMNPIYDFLSNKTNLNKIGNFTYNYTKTYNEYLQSDIITNKKDVNLIKKAIQSDIKLVSIASIEKIVHDLHLGSIDLSNVLYISKHKLVEPILNYIPKENNLGLTINEIIKIAQFAKSENLKPKNLRSMIDFIKKHDFNKEKILVLNKNLSVKSIVQIYSSDFTKKEIQYLMSCKNDKYIDIIINNFDIKKHILENVYNNIKYSEIYNKFIELSNNKFSIPDTNILNLYINDTFKIYNSFMKNSYIGNKSKEVYESMFEAYVNNEFENKKFETLESELDEPIPDDIKKTWTKCYTNNASEYTIFDTIDFNMTMKIGVTPVTTCMDYSSGIYSKALVSNLDANKKIIFVKNGKGQIVARSILKLTKIRTDDVSDNTLKKHYALIIEKVYTSDDNPNVPKLIAEFVKEHYKDLIILGKSNFEDKDAKSESVSVFVTNSRNKIQYSDSLGGELHESDIGTYKKHDMYIL